MKLTLEPTGRLVELGVADSMQITRAELWQGITEIDGRMVRVLAVLPVLIPLLDSRDALHGEFDAERDVAVEPWPEAVDFPAWIGL